MGGGDVFWNGDFNSGSDDNKVIHWEIEQEVALNFILALFLMKEKGVRDFIVIKFIVNTNGYNGLGQITQVFTVWKTVHWGGTLLRS